MKIQSIGHERLKRAKNTLIGLLLIFAILLGRILWIQTIDFDRYLSEVIDQITTRSTLRADRGVIYDRNGNVLATSRTTYRVFISPSSIKRFERDAGDEGKSYSEHIARGLSEILKLEYETVLKQTTYTRYLDRTIAKNVSNADADRVREFIEENGYHDMVYLEASSARYYPNGELCSSVIGFTNSDGVGIYGLEAFYNEALSGKDGYYLTARDSFGNEMPYQYDSYIPAESGNNLKTTIDAYIQSVLEEQLMAALRDSDAKNRACGIVVDVKTGAILAMATVPGFDLNDPFELNEYYSNFLLEDGYATDSEEYRSAESQYLLDMWRNKSVSDSYIPGSTFKVMTSAMALTENKVKLSGDSVFCSGSLHLYGHTIHCHKTKGHGSLTFPEGLVQSCNVWFMTIGQRLGVSTFSDYFKSFGYREKTGIDLPGEANSIIKSKNEMTELDLSIYAFGQNFNITPIQHIMAISAVANGGYLLEPYLVEEITDSSGNTLYSHDFTAKRQVVSSEVCSQLASILEEGVSGDGGAKNAYVTGYKVAAKTGTSEKKGTDIRVEGVKPYVCSCVAFAPADDPQIAVLMMVDEPSEGILYGSVVAAPYVGALLDSVLPYIGEERDTSTSLTVKVPDLIGMKADEAKELAISLGYDVMLSGEGNYVTSQVPKAKTEINKANKTITIYVGEAQEESTVTVPDLLGKSAFEANRLIYENHLNIKVVGAENYMQGSGAFVIEQSIPPGSKVPQGTVIIVRFRYLTPD